MRTLDELTNQDDPAIPLVREWASHPTGNGGLLLPPDREVADATLLRLQVTTRSPLGAIVYETGGVIVGDGLLRLLGSGTERSLLRSNGPLGWQTDDDAKVLLVADDVLGGLFALNGGGFGPAGLGNVFHLGANDFVWNSLEVGYSDFVSWCLTGDLMTLYEPLASMEVFKRRPRPPLGGVYSFYPFLWSKEARVGTPDVRVVSADENIGLRLEMSGLATA